jgi:hypothetical protein
MNTGVIYFFKVYLHAHNNIENHRNGNNKRPKQKEVAYVFNRGFNQFHKLAQFVEHLAEKT